VRTIHISTVGKSPEPVIDGFRTHTVDHQVLLFSKETAPVARKIQEQIENLSGHRMCELVEVDAFNMTDIVGKILYQWQQSKGTEFYVNITGGTNIMASSALVACFIIGGRAYYMKESREEQRSLADSIVRIPVPKVSIDSLDDTQRKILKRILERGGKLTKANLSLSEELGEAPQLVSYHLRELQRKELIELASVGREKTVTLTDAGRFYAQIV
jgi:CRISPR locus-related DNA-binding protein